MKSIKTIKYLFNNWTIIGIFLSLFSFWLYKQGHALYHLESTLFIKLSLISIFFWTGIGHLLKAMPKVIGRIGSFVFSFVLFVLLIMSYVFYFEYKDFLSTGVVLLLRAQPVYFNSYFSQITTNPLIMGGLVLFALLLSWVLYPKKKPTKNEKYIHLGLGLVIVLVCNVFLNNNFRFSQKNFQPMDIQSFYSIRQGFSTNPKDEKPLNHFVLSMDESLKKDSEKKWNIVVIVFESFSREPLSFLGFDNNYTPFMDNWIKSESDQFILMDKSIAVSGATDVSMPSIYTGVGPEKDYQDLVTAPFLWDFAKAKGLKTYYATSQDQSWKGMKTFVEDPFLDLFYHPEVLGLPLVNDIGADDLTVVDSLQKVFTKDTAPFFLFYNTNATHSPHQNSSPYISDFKGIDTRYGRALFITDKIVEGIVEMIKKRGELDNTIFVFTADHGIYTVKRRSRLSSYFKEALDIPMMIRLPNSWVENHPNKMTHLRKNKKKLVTNLDIAPTVFDFLFPNSSKDAYHFSGSSLLDSINEERSIVCLSTNETRMWDSEGFGIYKNNESYIFHDNTGLHFYNLATDPKQENDLISEIPADKKIYYDSIITNNYFLKNIYQKYNKVK